VVGQNVQYFCKPPGIGRPTPPHQDGFYFMLSPCEAVTLWLALDVVGKDNGCVRYVRGSHLQGMRQHCRTSTLGFSQGVADYGRPEDLANEMPAIAEPGDLLAHHALTIHRADANRSPARTRRALGLVYFSARAQQDAEAHQQYQQQLMEGLAKSGRI
jgi:phytanoyl-CoA hydroxylase